MKGDNEIVVAFFCGYACAVGTLVVVFLACSPPKDRRLCRMLFETARTGSDSITMVYRSGCPLPGATP